MNFSKNADVMTATIMWIGVVIAVIISLSWFLTKLKPDQVAQETIRFDLSEIKQIVERACTSISFFKDYNPRTEEGYFFANQTNACINSSIFFDCITLTCNNSNTAVIDLSNITYIKIAMDENMSIRGVNK